MCRLNPVTVAISTDVPKWCSSQTKGNSVVPKLPTVCTGKEVKDICKCECEQHLNHRNINAHLYDEVALEPETDNETEQGI